MFWDMMEDVETGETVAVIKVGIDRVADASHNLIVRGTTEHDGVTVVDADPVPIDRTVPIENGKVK